MAAAVLDASAVLAFIKAEPGSEAVMPYIGTGIISAVNVQEVAKNLLSDGIDLDTVRMMVSELRLDVRPHDAPAAYEAASLVEATARFGRGLGDRTCLALGLALKLPVVTADREWANVVIDSLTIEQIR